MAVNRLTSRLDALEVSIPAGPFTLIRLRSVAGRPFKMPREPEPGCHPQLTLAMIRALTRPDLPADLDDDARRNWGMIHDAWLAGAQAPDRTGRDAAETVDRLLAAGDVAGAESYIASIPESVSCL